MKPRGSQFDPGIPPEYGSQPIPEGMVRFHHYTQSPENLPSIMSQGLLERHAQESYARGGTESPETFATSGAPSTDFKRSHNFVEGWANPARGGQLNIGENWRDTDPAEYAADLESRRNTITFRGDVPANQIIGAHEPWHDTFRYLQGEPQMERGIVAGDYDTRDWASQGPDTRNLQRAVDTTKLALSAKVMVGGKLQGKSYEDEGIPTKRNPKKAS